MKKPTQAMFAGSGFEAYRKPTRRELFLAEMERVVPWGELCALIELVYPKSEDPGRPAIDLERMLRIYFLQHWFNLSDPTVEGALYESVSTTGPTIRPMPQGAALQELRMGRAVRLTARNSTHHATAVPQ